MQNSEMKDNEMIKMKIDLKKIAQIAAAIKVRREQKRKEKIRKISVALGFFFIGFSVGHLLSILLSLIG